MGAASVIGEDLMGMGFRLDPWPVWERLRHDHPVFWNEITKQWVITRYDDVCAVFADNDHFSNSIYEHSLGVVFGRTMLQLDGAEHVSLRKVVSPELVGNNLARYLDVIRCESSVLIDAFPDGPVELVGAFTNRMPVNVIVAMLGMPGDDHDRFHDWYSTMMAALVFGKPERRPGGIAAREELMAHVAP